MKYRILTRPLVASLLIVLVGACQPKAKAPKAQFIAEAFVPPYTLIIPENWTTERFAIPIDFAPSIPYTGVEDLRFAPGWDNSASDEYWTYSYLWYLDGKIAFDAATLEKNLEAYYTGLVGRNIDKRKIPTGKLVPVKASFAAIKTQEGDLTTFKGSVNMLDYMAQQPITLNCLVHVKECPGKNNTFAFYEISPREETHAIWTTLDKIWTEFQCDAR